MYSLDTRNGRKHFWNSHSLLERELDKFFTNKEEVFHVPACDVYDEEKHYAISLDIPGMREEDITIEVKDNHLYVSGERKYEKKTEKENLLRTEKRYGKFSRVFTLPQNVASDAIEAQFENGVLDIILPKEEKAQTRKISIMKKSDHGSDAGLKN